MRDFVNQTNMTDLLAATRCRWADTPEKVALAEGDEHLTFGVLEARANHMARKLVKEGARVGDFVGYVGPTGVPFVVTFWACLKAGLTFLPISSKFPPASVVDVLQTARARFFVSNLDLPEVAPDLCALPIPGAEEDPCNFEVPSVPEEVLCIANSTSGSTGIPKVVGHSRLVLASSAVEEAASAGTTETSVVGHCGTMWAVSILSALSVGAKVTCHDPTSGTPQDLLNWLKDAKVTYWFTYPALFRTLVDTIGTLPDMRVLLVCGEAVFRQDFELFERITHPGATFLNTYGQQEFLWATAFPVRNGDRLKFEKIPAGKSICDNDPQVLDDAGRPVSAGQIGEITHHSYQVPCGYIGDPVRSNAVFSTGEDGVRTFATGDLGYIDGGGNLHVVGRKDDQIKIRNFNVQPSDLEQEIKLHPELREVAVTVSYCKRDLPRLVCFYEGAVSPEALKTWLSARIPAFMVPQFFVSVDALPRTATGKVQRNKLRLADDASDVDRIPPETEEQFILFDIWQQVLGHDNFGITDNFFDVGGDSLRAMELLLQIDQQFGRLLTLDRVILTGADIASLAELLQVPSTPSQLRTLKPGGGTEHIVVSHVYGGGVTDYLKFARAIGSGVKVSGICADYSGRNRAYPIRKKAQEAFAHVPDDPEMTLMGYSFGGRMAFEIAQLTGHQNRIVLIDPVGPFSESLKHKIMCHGASVFMKSPGLGKEREHYSDYWYWPKRLTTQRALLVTCDTSFEADIAGWSAVLDGPVDRYHVTGNHWDILRGSNAFEIADKVQDWLSETSGRSA